MAQHVHAMKREGGHYKCASCEFRCTRKALNYVNNNPHRHVLKRRADPSGKLIIFDLEDY